MQLPINHFKQALRDGRTQIGLWHGLPDPYVTELLAGAGYDWLCIDAEHSPNDLRNVLAQLQAIAPYATNPVVRTVDDGVAMLKQYLDIGAQTLLVPMVESVQQAERIVAATRYPPGGIRGVGSALARASRWTQVPDYLQSCEEQLCVLVQIETVRGLRLLPEIVRVEGVDGIFFGPSDLAASMQLLGQSGAPAVQQAILEGISIVRAAGKAAGVLSTEVEIARKYRDAGAQFVAVGLDTTLLVRGAVDLVARLK